MDATAIFQALTQAILISLVQGLVIYMLTRLVLTGCKDLSAFWRYNVWYTSLLVIFLGFLFSFYRFYDSADAIPIGSVRPALLPGTQTGATLQTWKAYTIPYSYWIAGIYISGLSYQALLLFAGFYRLRINRLKGHAPLSAFWKERLAHFQTELGIARKITFQFSDHILVPFTAGFLKPIILFPLATVNQLSIEQLEAILLHELAHIKRNDYLMNIIQRVIEIMLFFNPAAWLLARQIKAEREFCCDDLVIQYTSNPLTYARALTLIEDHRITMNNLAVAANGNNKYGLLKRIQKITQMKSKNSNPKHRLLALLGLLAISLSVAWVVPADSTRVKSKKESAARQQTKPSKLQKDAPVALPGIPTPPDGIPKHPLPAPALPPNPKIELLPKPAPPVPVDTNKIKKYFDSAEWKAREEALKKTSEEISKYFDSPEWKAKELAIEKNSAELEKKFNSPEWQAKVKDLENLSADLEKKFNGPEWKEKMKDLEQHSKELEKKFNSPEWKEKMKSLEQHGKELEKKFNSPEWKEKMKKLEEQSKELGKKFNSPEWKKKMKELEQEELKEDNKN